MQQVKFDTASDKMTKAFIDLIQGEFKFPLLGRLEVIADVDHYKPGEDESVWMQKKGIAPQMFEVYWDGEWIMDFAHETEIEITIALFWQSFLKAYEANRIRLVEGMAELEPKDQNLDNLLSYHKKKLVKRPATQSPTDKVADLIVDGIKKESHGSKTAT